MEAKKNFQMCFDLMSSMVISLKIKDDLDLLKEYIQIKLNQKENVLLVLDPLNQLRMEEFLLANFDDEFFSKKIEMVDKENFIKNFEKILNDFKTAKKGKKYHLAFFKIKNFENKTNLMRYLVKENYRYFFTYSVTDFSIEELVEYSSFFQAILLEEENETQVYSNKKIKEVTLILKSIKSYITLKKDTYENVKALEHLSNFICVEKQIKDVEGFLLRTLKFFMKVASAKMGCVLKKKSDGEVEILFNYGVKEEYIKDQQFKFSSIDFFNEFCIDKNQFFKLNITKNIYIFLGYTLPLKSNHLCEFLSIAVISIRGVIQGFQKKLRNEELIKRNEKMNALSELSNGVVHEFKDTLAAIKANVEISIQKTNCDRSKKYLETIKRAYLDGAQMIKRIELFTKDVREDEKQEWIDLNFIIEIALSMMKPEIENLKRKNIFYKVKTSLKSKSMILARGFEIREVIINIIKNAFDAMKDGGTLSIKTYDLENKIFVEIKDTGEGIAESHLEKIFEPFFSTKGIDGNGIGLSVTYKIIKSHLGDIKVESKLKEGTKFLINFPIAKDFLEKEENIKEEKRIFKKRILVVDDKINVAQAVGELIKTINSKVDIVYSAKEAIEKIKRNEYDIILSDLAMPKMNGIELCKKIKIENPNIAFALMTGWIGDLSKYEIKYVDKIIEKPFGIEEIRELLDEI